MKRLDNLKTVWAGNPPANQTTTLFEATERCMVTSVFITNNNDSPMRLSGIGVTAALPAVPTAATRWIHSMLFPGKDDLDSKVSLSPGRIMEVGERITCTMPAASGNWNIEVTVYKDTPWV